MVKPSSKLLKRSRRFETSIEAKLVLERKKHLYQTQSQEALGFHSRCAASKLGGAGEERGTD
jgi:hypothetical protein